MGDLLKQFQHLTQQMDECLYNLNRSHNFNFSFTLHVAVNLPNASAKSAEGQVRGVLMLLS